MKRNRLVATTVASTITLALALTACGSGDSGSGDGASADGSGDIRVWLVGTDTPKEAREYLKTTFEAENEGSTLTIEEQSWTGLVDKLTTSLASSDSPDVVEVGNTQAAAFTSAGFFTDLTDKYEELGGDDLLKGFVEAGSYDDKFYAAPYYSGARAVFYSQQIVGDGFVAPRPSTTTSPRARPSRRTRARASTGPARTGTTVSPTSGRTVASSPRRRATSGRPASPPRAASRASSRSRTSC